MGASPVVIIGHSLWQRRLASDPNVVGKTIELNNRTYHVIGVAPEYFKGTKFGLSLDFWAPMAMAEDLQRAPKLLSERGDHWMNVFARLKPGATRPGVSGVDCHRQRLNQAYQQSRQEHQVVVQTETTAVFWEEAAVT